MRAIRDAILSGERDAGDLRGAAGPRRPTAAVTVHRDEEGMFDGLASRDKDPRKSLHVERGRRSPSSAPGEALVAVMASAINYNTVWTSIFEPVSTFRFLRALRPDLAARPSGTTCPTTWSAPTCPASCCAPAPGCNAWKPGDEVVAHCLSVELERADGHNDTMLDPEQRIWGFETNFGGLAELALVKTNQLMPKPAHLTWEEAAVPGLVNSTAYRQLVSRNGAGMKLGDVVLVWGASGGLGSYATQMALAGGRHPRLRRVQPGEGRDLPPDGRRAGHRPVSTRGLPRSGQDEPSTQDPREWRRFGATIRALTGGRDPDIVFEHPGRETFGASVFVARTRRHDRHLRLDRGLPARVRQPLPLDEPQADHRLALRELPRGVGGQRPDRPGADPPDPEPDVPDGGRGPGRLRRPPQPAPGQGRRPRARARREGLGVTDPSKRERHLATSSAGSATSERDGPACRRRPPRGGAVSVEACSTSSAGSAMRLREPRAGVPGAAARARARRAGARPAGRPRWRHARGDDEQLTHSPAGRHAAPAGRPSRWRPSPTYRGAADEPLRPGRAPAEPAVAVLRRLRRRHRGAAGRTRSGTRSRQLGRCITLLVVAFFLTLSLNPVVELLVRRDCGAAWRWPPCSPAWSARSSRSGSIVVPPVMQQAGELAQSAPGYLNDVLSNPRRPATSTRTTTWPTRSRRSSTSGVTDSDFMCGSPAASSAPARRSCRASSRLSPCWC